MTQEELFEAWAPESSEWSEWAKPVLFAHVGRLPGGTDPQPGATDVKPGESEAQPTATDAAAELAAFANRLPREDGATALVLDLPGPLAARLSEVLTEKGFRPVPLYNSCPAPERSLRAAIAVAPIVDALVANAAPLYRSRLPGHAPPAFLLDAERRIGSSGYLAEAGTFDNRSISLPTDFPSSNFLRSRGIERAVLVQKDSLEPQADLAHTLLRWQQNGIAIYAVALDASLGEAPRVIFVQRPSMFRVMWYAFTARMGLRPHPLGGFGGLLPEYGSAG